MDPGGGHSFPELLVDSVVLFSAVSCCSHGVAFLARRASFFFPSLGCSCSSSASSRHTSRLSLPLPLPPCHVRIQALRQFPGSSEWPVMLMCFSVFLQGEKQASESWAAAPERNCSERNQGKPGTRWIKNEIRRTFA